MSEIRIIYGFHAVTSRLRQSVSSIKELYLDSAREDRRAQDLLKTAEGCGARVMRVDEKRLDEILSVEAMTRGGIAGQAGEAGKVERS